MRLTVRTRGSGGANRDERGRTNAGSGPASHRYLLQILARFPAGGKS